MKKGYGTTVSQQLSRRGATKGNLAPSFPKQQLFIIALCRICEPIAFMSIFPYIYHMVRDFGITQDESQISIYAGMITSAFTFAEFSTGVMWGRLSDRLGRKPILLTGLCGTGLSVLMFGFAPNLWVALAARALGGALNGNIGVLQTTVAELITVKEHQARAYTVMPMVWCLGSIIGPMIGGALARPVDAFPNMFTGALWTKYPYLLPNLFSAICVLFSVIIGLLFLEETHPEKKHNRDRGVELGKRVLSYWKDKVICGYHRTNGMEEQGLLEPEDLLPGYCLEEESCQLAMTPSSVVQNPFDLESAVPLTKTVSPERKPTGKIFTRPVILIIISYGILAFHTMTFDQLFPVFLSTDPPADREPPKLPFKFVDGFGYDTHTTGMILSVQGVYSMISTFFFFPFVSQRLGNLTVFRFLSMAYFVQYLITPYLVLLPDSIRLVGVYGMIIWKCTFATMAYPTNALLLTNSAPSTLSLGTINGVAASTASLCRAFGPTISGWLYALGIEIGYSGLAWWFTGLVTIVGGVISFHMTEPKGRFDEKEEMDADLGYHDNSLEGTEHMTQ